MEKIKAYNWWLILYPDDETHMDAMRQLDSIGCKWSAVLHDHDVNPDTGEIKKAHWNVVIRFASQRYLEPVATQLGVAPNYLRKIDNVKDAHRYHFHTDHPERGVYSIDNLLGNDLSKVQSALKDSVSDESSCVLEIIELLDEMPRIVTIKEMLTTVCARGLYATYRRMGNLGTQLLLEHNNKYRTS